ncbi:uncharacterized protein zgc:123010 [Osmerus eperlanus]|uniref:uncharacterized protein zgc:123010 n=1 Tax=Osmerus eperlanus TaxID=29151 RepID=UPI002E145871
MVALMKFTRDICRLLGIVSEGPSTQQDLEQDCGASVPDASSHARLAQDYLNGEEGLSEEEKVKRRAERRRAKRKRQRERRKMEQVQRSTEQDDEDEDDVESEESESEIEGGGGVVEEEDKHEHQGSMCCSKDEPGPPPCTSGPPRAPTGPSEEEPEWDVSSAFVSNAASHIKPKGWTKPGRKSKENKENEARTSEENGSDATIKRSASLTEKGIKMVQEGQYSQAVSMFTEAIRYDPADYRFFGNRSYCYACLEQYPQALADAERSIGLAPDWPKGYFRQGSALMGLKRYSEAEQAMEKVLKLDQDCEEAVNDLFNCKVLQLMDLGFEEMQGVLLLDKFSTVQAVLSSPGASRALSQESSLVQPGSPCQSLWVGNVTAELTEKQLWDLFKTHGEIDSIRVLHKRFCAFVNFQNANMASRALEKLNGYSIENTRLVVRYPDRRTQRVLHTPLKTSLPATEQAAAAAAAAAGQRRRGPVNGDECYFWRSTGCHFGDKCRYKHFPEQRGKDRKPWQP